MEKEEVFSEEKLKERARSTSIKEGCAYGLMDGFGVRNITPYALALGSSNFLIGLLSSLPSLLGNFSQLFAPKLMEKHSRKKIVLWSVISQAILWIFILLPGIIYYLFNIHSSVSPILLVIIYTALIVGGSVGGPAWSSMMRDVIPKKERGRYFGIRNRITGFSALTFALIGGFILDYFKDTKIFLAFAILFLFSFVGRAISAYFFTKQYEPKFHSEEGYYFSLTQFMGKMFYNNFGKFVIFVSLLTFASSVAGPFFSVYLLKNLNIPALKGGYVFYFIITLSASVATILFMPLWGKLSDKYGNLRVMKITGIFIPLVAIFYLLSSFFNTLTYAIIFIFFIEAFSGFIWAGFNLAASNFIYDAVTAQRHALCVAYFNILNGTGAFTGAMLGGIIASFDFVFFGLNSILFIFLLSGILRLAVYFVMVRKIKEVRDVPNFDLFSGKRKFKFFGD